MRSILLIMIIFLSCSASQIVFGDSLSRKSLRALAKEFEEERKKTILKKYILHALHAYHRDYPRLAMLHDAQFSPSYRIHRDSNGIPLVVYSSNFPNRLFYYLWLRRLRLLNIYQDYLLRRAFIRSQGNDVVSQHKPEED